MNTSLGHARAADTRRLTSWRMLADTATVGGWTAAVKVLGAVKVILAARMFGASDAMDAYLIAFLVPSCFIDIFAAPLDSALIPSLIELRETKGRTEAQALYATVLAGAGSALLAAALLVAVLSGLLLPLLASGFPSAKLALTQQLLLVMMVVVPLSGLSSTWRAVLNSELQFGYAAAVPAVTPMASILALVLYGQQYGVLALAIGTLAGGCLEAVLAGAGVKRLGYAVLPKWSG